MEGTAEKVMGIQMPTYYAIDFEKVNTVEDIKIILESLNIILPAGHKNLDKMKHLLKRVQ